MALEIERKFLIKNDSWRSRADNGTIIKQGYLNSAIERTVRVRIYGTKGVLTIKGKNENLTRKEFEYEIPLDEALSLIDLCENPVIEKTRYLLIDNGNIWEIDVFERENEGLIVAEIELKSEDQLFEIPEWLGKEVSTESKYFNSALISQPFCNWKKE